MGNDEICFYFYGLLYHLYGRKHGCNDTGYRLVAIAAFQGIYGFLSSPTGHFRQDFFNDLINR